MKMFLNIAKNYNINKKLILGVQTSETNLIPDTDLIQIFDDKLFLTISEAIAEQKFVYLTPFDDKISFENIIIDDNSNSTRENAIYELHKMMAKIFCRIPQYTFFRYTFLNNIFASKGIFITSENREEKYIEILEKDDENLINFLEEYITIVNELNSYDKLYGYFLTILEELKNSDDDEKINALLVEAKLTLHEPSGSVLTKKYFSSTDCKYEYYYDKDEYLKLKENYFKNKQYKVEKN